MKLLEDLGEENPALDSDSPANRAWLKSSPLNFKLNQLTIFEILKFNQITIFQILKFNQIIYHMRSRLEY